MRIITCLALCLQAPAGEAPSLTVQVVASADPALEDRWTHAEADQFEVHRTERVCRGQNFLWNAFFSGYGLDPEGRAVLTYSARITRPDGKIYHESDGHVGFDGTTEPGLTLLGVEGIGTFFESTDKLGTYHARFEANDGVSGANATCETEIELVAYEEGAAFADGAELRAWAYAYAKAPDPTRLVPALWRQCAEGGFGPEAKQQDIDGFLLEAFEHNAWLLPELMRDWKRRTADEKRGVLALLAHAPEDAEALVKKLPKEDKAAWSAASSASDDPRARPLAGPRDLNLLQGRYIAHRALAPLQRLILALHADGAVISTESTRSKDGVDVPLTAVVPRVVKKKLGELFAYDPLARSYADTLSAAGGLPPGVAEVLDALLSEGK